MKTRNYLILMVAIILIPVMVFAAWGLDRLLEEEREARLGMVEAMARAVALDIDQEIAHAEGALQVIANTDFMKKGDFAALHALMSQSHAEQHPEHVRHRADSWLVLYNYDGTVRINTVTPYGTRYPGVRYDWVTAAIDSGKISVSNLREGKVSKAPVVSVNVPVVTSNGQKYLVSQVYPSSHFTRTLSNRKVPQTWIVDWLVRTGSPLHATKKLNG